MSIDCAYYRAFCPFLKHLELDFLLPKSLAFGHDSLGKIFEILVHTKVPQPFYFDLFIWI